MPCLFSLNTRVSVIAGSRRRHVDARSEAWIMAPAELIGCTKPPANDAPRQSATGPTPLSRYGLRPQHTRLSQLLPVVTVFSLRLLGVLPAYAGHPAYGAVVSVGSCQVVWVVSCRV
ncbi:hypothetical protein GCM10027053_24220 [Intrasporangium mesophilum]